MLFRNLMHEPCKPGRKHQLDEDGTEDVMHEPGKTHRMHQPRISG